MNFTKTTTMAAAVVLLAGPVAAQTVGIGTTAKGATSQVTAAIASVVSKFGGMQRRPSQMQVPKSISQRLTLVRLNLVLPILCRQPGLSKAKSYRRVCQTRTSNSFQL